MHLTRRAEGSQTPRAAARRAASRRAIVTLVLLGAASFQGFSQGLDSLWNRVVHLISSPAVQLDPESVYQPAPYFSISLSGGLRQAGMSQENHLTYTDGSVEAYSTTRLKGIIDKGIGMQVGYGKFTLGVNHKLGDRTKSAKRDISFAYLSPSYALQLHYLGFRRPVEYEVGIKFEDDLDEPLASGETENPVKVTAFIADGAYALNRRDFAYSAVYKGNVIQRRSAGTFMLGAKFIQGMVEYDPDEDISGLMMGMTRQTTLQASAGGGFSYNHVFLHRQPGADGTGLRNLTMNITGIPMLTILNRFTSTIQRETSSGKKAPEKSVMNGKIRVNYVVRAGVIYSWDNFFVSVDGSYDSFAYTGRTDVSDYNLLFETIDSSGKFTRWSMSAKVGVKF